MQEFAIRKLFDGHTHLREGQMLQAVAPLVAEFCQAVVPMPNLKIPVTDVALSLQYEAEILRASEFGLRPFMTIMLTDQTSSETIRAARPENVKVCKYYPVGVTNSSGHGVKDICRLLPVFEEMIGYSGSGGKYFSLSIHAEEPGVGLMEAEPAFIPTLAWLIDGMPRLRVIVEHISSVEMIEFVKSAGPNVFGTIAPQYLINTRDDVFDANEKVSQPLNWCKPAAKYEKDRAAIVEAAVNSTGKFFYGSDFAPHPWSKKMADDPAPGCANYPAGVYRMIEVFESAGRLDNLENFTSTYGANAHFVRLLDEKLHFVKTPHTIPVEMPISDGEVLRFWEGGKQVSWTLI